MEKQKHAHLLSQKGDDSKQNNYNNMQITIINNELNNNYMVCIFILNIMGIITEYISVIYNVHMINVILLILIIHLLIQ